MSNRQPEPERRPSALDRIRAAEVEEFGVDFVLGFTDKPERRLPPRAPRDRTAKAAPLGWKPEQDED